MNFNLFKNISRDNIWPNNNNILPFIKNDQKFDILSFGFPEKIGTCSSYIEDEENKELFNSQQIFHETKNFNMLKNNGKFDTFLAKKNFDNKENELCKDIIISNNKKDSSDLLKTNYVSKKIKVEKKIKNIRFKNEIKAEYNKTKDNVIRKCKNLLLTYIRKFINVKIKEIYDDNIGEGIWRKEILDINSEQKSDNRTNSIKNLLNKTLKEIFSVNISLRYTSYLSNHNKEIIQRFLNENDEKKREKFQKLFNLKFSDCLNKFRDNSIDYEGLEGFPNFDDIKYDLNEDEGSLDKMKKFLKDFENIIKSKKPRNRILAINNLKNK